MIETVILTFFDVFHAVSTYFVNLKTFFVQSLVRLFKKRKHSVEFHFSCRVIKLRFIRSATAFFRVNTLYLVNTSQPYTLLILCLRIY